MRENLCASSNSDSWDMPREMKSSDPELACVMKIDTILCSPTDHLERARLAASQHAQQGGVRKRPGEAMIVEEGRST